MFPSYAIFPYLTSKVSNTVLMCTFHHQDSLCNMNNVFQERTAIQHTTATMQGAAEWATLTDASNDPAAWNIQ